MAAMVLTAVTLLAFTYKGSQSGKEESGGPEGMSDAQIAMPGYQVLFEEGTFETCGACHQLGGLGGGNVGPDLTDVGTRYDSADDLTEVMANGLGGGAMPVKGGAPLTDEQAAQVAAFLKTLGVPDEAETLSTYGLEDWERVTGAGGESQGTDTEAADDAADPASTDEAAQGTTEEPADAGSDG
jgi:mono/diheme cytochrome c family protein